MLDFACAFVVKAFLVFLNWWGVKEGGNYEELCKNQLRGMVVLAGAVLFVSADSLAADNEGFICKEVLIVECEQAPSWLKDAKTHAAVISILRSGQVIWKNGLWEDGIWLGGIE